MNKTTKAKQERLCRKTFAGEGFTLVACPGSHNIGIDGDYREVMKRADALLHKLTPNASAYVYTEVLISGGARDTSASWMGRAVRVNGETIFED